MINKIESAGTFENSSLHELVIRVIGTRFSGSVEIDFEECKRILHFSGGKLCGASSTDAGEQLDGILENEKASMLTDEQHQALAERLEEGQTYGKALVDTGIMSATELLGYNNNLAESILKGGLADKPAAFRTSATGTPKGRQLDVNALGIIFKDILTNLDPEYVREKLGDENIRYRKSANNSAHSTAGSLLVNNPEVDNILSHLDGTRSVRDLAGRIGLNPDRTSRILLFLKWVRWIEPSTGSGGKPMVEDTESIITTGLVNRYTSGTADEEEESSADILKLLDGDDEPEIKSAAPVPRFESVGSVPETLGDQYQDSIGDDLTGLLKDDYPDTSYRTAEEPLEDTARFTLEKPGMNTRRLFLRYILPIAGVLILIFAVTFGMIALFSSPKVTPPAAKEEPEDDMSFYSEDIEQGQLPLDKEFTNTPPEHTEPIQVPVEETTPATTAETTSTTGQETGQSGETDTKEPEENSTQPESKPVDKPAAEVKQPDAFESRVMKMDKDAAQDMALDRGMAGAWDEAVRIWTIRARNSSNISWTIHIQTVSSSANLSDIFENFANSSTLVRDFMVFKANGRYLVCFGIFPGRSAANAEMISFPNRIKSYKPEARRVHDLVR